MIKSKKGKLITAAVITIILDFILYIWLGITIVIMCAPCMPGAACHCPSGFDVALPYTLLLLVPLYGVVLFIVHLVNKFNKNHEK